MTVARTPADPLVSGAAGRRVAEEALRTAIASGEVVPGQRLVEADLADAFGVTRGSARLALDALVADGLVERVRNRGARVRTVTTEEAVEIMECRTVLDGLLSRRAAQRATPAEVDRLRAHHAVMRAAVARSDLVEYSALIQQQHALVRAAARHRTADALVEQLQAQIVRHQFRLSLRPGRAQESLEELGAVVDAIAGRDADAAEAAARAHGQAVVAVLRAG